jgi:hypothetical protein
VGAAQLPTSDQALPVILRDADPDRLPDCATPRFWSIFPEPNPLPKMANCTVCRDRPGHRISS